MVEGDNGVVEAAAHRTELLEHEADDLAPDRAINPRGNRILARPVGGVQTRGGIVLPDTEKGKFSIQEVEVVAVGEKVEGLAVGQRALVIDAAGLDLGMAKHLIPGLEDVRFYDGDDILAVVE